MMMSEGSERGMVRLVVCSGPNSQKSEPPTPLLAQSNACRKSLGRARVL
jgi:hypothetical protein